MPTVPEFAVILAVIIVSASAHRLGQLGDLLGWAAMAILRFLGLRKNPGRP